MRADEEAEQFLQEVAVTFGRALRKASENERPAVFQFILDDVERAFGDLMRLNHDLVAALMDTEPGRHALRMMVANRLRHGRSNAAARARRD